MKRLRRVLYLTKGGSNNFCNEGKLGQAFVASKQGTDNQNDEINYYYCKVVAFGYFQNQTIKYLKQDVLDYT